MKNFITDTIKPNAPPWDLINIMLSGIDTNISTGQEKEKNSGHRYKKTEKTGDDLKN